MAQDTGSKFLLAGVSLLCLAAAHPALAQTEAPNDNGIATM